MTDLARAPLDDLDPASLDALTDLIWPRILVRLDAVVEAPERLLTASEAASRANVNVETIYRAARSGALAAGRVGRAIRIDPADLEQWIRAGERRHGPGVPGTSTRARRSRAGRPMADALERLDRAE